MTPDDIRLALENAEGIPESALRAAVGDAAAVAPAVIAVVQRMARGCLPLPREERLLRFGLHALAAAREASACPAFLALLRRPPIELEWLFGEDRARVVARLLLGLFDGEDAAVCAVAADRDVDEDVRSGLLSAWARLVWEGRASRERLLELLDRFDQDELAPPQSLAWIGWQEAISLLGLTDWIERVQRGWETRMSPSVWRDVDRQDWIERTRAAHADPGDAERFDRLSIAAGDDPMADIDWSAEPPSEPDEPPTGDEVAWLEQLLWQKVPAGTMCLEEADGFLTALAAGPVRVPPAEFLPEIWRTPEGKRFDTPEHAALAGDLLTRLYVSIEATLAQAQPVEPWINQDVGELEGTLWANGFMQAVTSHATAWDALSRSRRLVEHTLMPILALIPEAVGEDAEQLLPERRLEVIDMLPDAVGTIHEFWQRGYDAMPRAEPVRVQKIGRNAPCPCGSGRKYKKCCGAAA